MSAILDLVGSFFIGGLLLMMIMRVNANFNEANLEGRLELMVQQNTVEIVEILEYDFKKIGFGISNPNASITAIDTSSITFRADLENTGTFDTIIYQLSLPAQASTTPNPNDRILFRTVNGVSVGGTSGISDFQLSYLDENGSITTNPPHVSTIEYTLEVQSTIGIDSVYARSFYSGKVSPKNLQ